MTNLDLTELERLHEAAPAGTWNVGKNKASGRVQVYNQYHQVCAVWQTTAHPAAGTADYIAALHNAFPELLQRLREALAKPQGAKQREAQAFLREAEGLLVLGRDLRLLELLHDRGVRVAADLGPRPTSAAPRTARFSRTCAMRSASAVSSACHCTSR